MFYEIAGWLGAILLLFGFIWNLRNPGASKNNTYMVINILGAFGIIINTYSAGAYPAAFFNIIWASAALVSLVKNSLVKTEQEKT